MRPSASERRWGSSAHSVAGPERAYFSDHRCRTRRDRLRRCPRPVRRFRHRRRHLSRLPRCRLRPILPGRLRRHRTGRRSRRDWVDRRWWPIFTTKLARSNGDLAERVFLALAAFRSLVALVPKELPHLVHGGHRGHRVLRVAFEHLAHPGGDLPQRYAPLVLLFAGRQRSGSKLSCLGGSMSLSSLWPAVLWHSTTPTNSLKSPNRFNPAKSSVINIPSRRKAICLGSPSRTRRRSSQLPRWRFCVCA